MIVDHAWCIMQFAWMSIHRCNFVVNHDWFVICVV
uniref:Uncharacterized protein n=1 Tax=Arundo donax TaxID=35708 RepID=A0A0A9B013_ARUDO